ncbi:MAG TPA: flagellar export chaperone FliS [Gammaproteobacteria bacterium]
MGPYRERSAMRHYHEIGVEAQVADATPHRLVQMLLDGAAARVAAAKGAMEAGETARKAELIGRVIDIVAHLRAALDADAGGELAANLDALYEYMERRLLEANLRNEPALLDEVSSLLKELQSGWRAIADTVDAASARTADEH